MRYKFALALMMLSGLCSWYALLLVSNSDDVCRGVRCSVSRKQLQGLGMSLIIMGTLWARNVFTLGN